ncbi:hypothetical protein OB919_09375 [Halobacteria archaeon AArc-curdl1]|uniref:Uncharacterized protein n=1 Tax=Natronosalvus hydrolyticus TaxID=2979988 RepID=A0AAP2Z7M8_9EURY|nr:hypothetical protein [Halobacteria archaeon AArc-curdl1]
MLTLNLENFMIELKDGSLKNVGPTNKSATAKLFAVEDAGAREFGDKRVKLVFEDDEGNEIQVALFPEQARAIADDLADLEESSPIFDE